VSKSDTGIKDVASLLQVSDQHIPRLISTVLYCPIVQHLRACLRPLLLEIKVSYFCSRRTRWSASLSDQGFRLFGALGRGSNWFRRLDYGVISIIGSALTGLVTFRLLNSFLGALLSGLVPVATAC
jgi:hypothetical protein